MNMSTTRKTEHRQTAPPFKASRTRGERIMLNPLTFLKMNRYELDSMRIYL